MCSSICALYVYCNSLCLHVHIYMYMYSMCVHLYTCMCVLAVRFGVTDPKMNVTKMRQVLYMYVYTYVLTCRNACTIYSVYTYIT